MLVRGKHEQDIVFVSKRVKRAEKDCVSRYRNVHLEEIDVAKIDVRLCYLLSYN